MAKVTDHIAAAQGKPLFSIEIIPPAKGSKIDELLESIEPMMELKPPFIDVTFHREEYFMHKMPDGSVKEVRSRKRPGTVGMGLSAACWCRNNWTIKAAAFLSAPNQAAATS